MSSTYLSLNFQLVFSTKDRIKYLSKDFLPDVHAYLGGITRAMNAVPIQVGGVEDHIHMLIGYKATHSVANLAQEIKKVSSVWIKTQIPDFSWQTGYAAISVSPDGIPDVIKYIQTQEEHHRTMTFEEERIMLLNLANIEFDPKYMD